MSFSPLSQELYIHIQLTELLSVSKENSTSEHLQFSSELITLYHIVPTYIAYTHTHIHQYTHTIHNTFERKTSCIYSYNLFYFLSRILQQLCTTQSQIIKCIFCTISHLNTKYKYNFLDKQKTATSKQAPCTIQVKKKYICAVLVKKNSSAFSPQIFSVHTCSSQL